MSFIYVVGVLLLVVIILQVYLIDKLSALSNEVNFTQNSLSKLLRRYNQQHSSYTSRNFEILSGQIENRLNQKVEGVETLIKDTSDKLWDKIDDTHDSLLS